MFEMGVIDQRLSETFYHHKSITFVDSLRLEREITFALMKSNVGVQAVVASSVTIKEREMLVESLNPLEIDIILRGFSWPFL